MTPRDRLQRLLIEHLTAHDPASSICSRNPDRRSHRREGSGAMIQLEREDLSWANRAVPVKSALPFIESRFGRYTHRVRSASLHTVCGSTHMSVKCWCGMHINISRRNPNRLAGEPSGRPICATCEGRAIGAGQLGAREIAGRQVMYQTRRGVTP